MLLHRVLAALVFAPGLLALVWWGGVPLGVTCLGLAAVMLWEFLRLTLGTGEVYTKTVAHLLALACGAALLGWIDGPAAALLVPVGTMLLLFATVAAPEPVEQTFNRAALVALGVLYTAGLIPFLARLRDLPELGLGLSLAALFCTWGADTGAYFAGRAFGRIKLYPKVSPGKTVEGLIGGTVAAVAVAFLVRWMFTVQITDLDTVVVGLIAGLFGIAGDLSESLLKRSVGAKDSSRLIPGHGGFLDRFDAVIFVAPAVFVYITMLSRS